jgi:ABC-type lipoprotein release transport system permease subunit
VTSNEPSLSAATSGWWRILLPTVAAVMFTVGILAALGPARRGLAVQPTEALREE